MIDLTVIYFNKKNLFQNLLEKTEIIEEIIHNNDYGDVYLPYYFL